jgi:pyruvoyl-dependent arginine decarboxylase (PvlArgDC)
MKVKSLLLTSFLLFFVKITYSQNTYDIVFSGNDRDQNCQTCFQAFNQKPKEVKFSIKRENNNLYFEVNDKNWFNGLFKNAGDGVAVDIVLKDKYNCKLAEIDKSQIRGFLLKPVYASQLKSGLKPKGDNTFRTYVGKIPEGFLNDDLEYNILFLGNKNLCRYYVIYDLESYAWDLLDMGMYLDSITYDTKQIESSSEEGFVVKNKTLKFIIPFKKNKSNYSQADIKPIYDSLRLTDFNIKAINIKAYSSVEGIESRNIELQKLRANSIVAALQTFQKSTIQTEVTSSENWVEFFNDIKGTKYAYLSTLSKNEVRDKIAGTISREMEPILKNHRKAVLELELEKKDKYKTQSAEVLVGKFNEAISAENFKEATEIQNSIFERLRLKEASPAILQKMNIPKQAKYVNFLNKNAAFKYMLDFRQALIVYNELLALEKLIPNDKAVKYNLVAIKLKLWRFRAIEVDENALKNDISLLKNVGINSSLISRMMVNYHIVSAENFMQKRDFTNKDKSVNYINTHYNKFNLTDYDYLSLAQFFSYYGNTNMAVTLLEAKARSIDINEDLLFYYLNLTLINKELTKKSDYRTILLNANNMNKERFCKLFNSVENGGVTFQLLEDEYLRKSYCETCQN